MEELCMSRAWRGRCRMNAWRRRSSSSPRLPPSDLHGVEPEDAVSPTLVVARALPRGGRPAVGSGSGLRVTDRSFKCSADAADAICAPRH